MVGTKVKYHPELRDHIVRSEFSPLQKSMPIIGEVVFNDEILVFDDIDWHTDLDVLFCHRVDRRKEYDDEDAHTQHKKGTAPKEVLEQLIKLEYEMDGIFQNLFGKFDGAVKATSWRPMIVGPEPIHFDSYEKEGVTTICAFVNFDREPRVWRVSYTLSDLLDTHTDLIREIWRDAKRMGSNFNVVLRARTFEDGPPFDIHHEIDFAQGSVWFCNPKTVSHGIHHGRGAYLYAKHIPGLDVPSQKDIIEERLYAEAI